VWERWNQFTKIFEKSTNNGASWTPLGLDASIITQGQIDPARLPTADPNIAYTNVNNQFTAYQNINADAARIQLNDTSAAVDKRKFEILSLAQEAWFHFINDAETAQESIPLKLTRTGDAHISANVRAGAGIFEAGRTVPMGHWVSIPYNAGRYGTYPAGTWSVPSGSVARDKYCIIGQTLHYLCMMNAMTTTGSVSHLALALAGLPSMTLSYHCGFARVVLSGPSIETGYLYTQPGDGSIYINRLNSAAWPASIGSIWFSMTFSLV
jgi:hypothetical protein